MSESIREILARDAAGGIVHVQGWLRTARHSKQVSFLEVHDGSCFAGLQAIASPELPGYEDTPAPFQALLTWSIHYPKAWRVTSFGGNVEPSGDDADEGSWLHRAIDTLGGLVRPAPQTVAKAHEQTTPRASFEEIVPMDKQRESVLTILTNGTGDGRLTISHTSRTSQIVFILLAIAAGIAGVVSLTRLVKPHRAGGAVILSALVFLAFAGRAWAPVWNGVLAAAVVTTAVLYLRELKRSKA